MKSPDMDRRLRPAQERLQKLQRRLGNAPETSLLDEALALLAEFAAAQPPLSTDDPALADLAETNRQLRALLDNTLVGIYRTTRDGRVLYANDALAQILGFRSAQEFMATNVYNTYADPAERDAFIAALEAAGGRLINYELTRQTPTGVHKHILTSAKLENDILTGVVVDVTGRIVAEKALGERARQLEIVHAVTSEIAQELDLERLLDLITRRAAEVVGAPAGTLFLWDETHQLHVPRGWFGPSGEGERVPRGAREGLIGVVAERREGLVINEYRAWAGASAAVLGASPITAAIAEPLLYRGRLIGVLAFNDFGTGRRFREEDRTFLALFATQAAIAIENARLFGEEQRRRRQFEALRQVGSEITRELDLDRLLTIILERAMQLVESNTGMVLLWDEVRHVLIPRVLLGNLAAMPKSPIPLGEGIVGRVAESRHGLIVNDYRTWTGARSTVLTHTVVNAGVAEPLLYRDRLIGVVNLGRLVDQPGFSDQDSELLRLFADQAAIAIENTRLYAAVKSELAEREETEKALRENETRLRTILESVPTGILLIDPATHRIVDVNPVAAKMIGLPKEEIVGAECHQFICPADQGQCPITDLCQRVDHSERTLLRGGVEPLAVIKTVARVTLEGRVHLLESFIDVSEQKRAEAALEARTQQLDAIRNVSEEIARELDLDRLLDLILRRAVGLADAQAGVILLWDEESQTLFPRVRFGDFFANMPKRSIHLGEGVVGHVAASRQGLVINDYRTWSGARPDALKYTTINASLGEPLLYRDTLIGVINLVHDSATGVFSEHHGFLLRLFASQAAIAIENARLFQAEQQRREQLEAVRLVSAEIGRELDLGRLLDLILRRAIEMLGADAGVIVLWDETTQTLFPRVRFGEAFTRMPQRPIPLGEGVVGHVGRTKQGLIVNDYRNWPGARPTTLQHSTITASLGEPLLYREQLIGVIGLAHSDGKGIFAAHQGTLLRLFADQAAIAIENARLYEIARAELAERTHAERALAQRTQQLEALRGITAEMTTELDLHRLLDLVTRRTAALFENVGSATYLWDESRRVLVPRAAIGAQHWLPSLRVVPGEGLAGCAVQERHGMIVNDYPSWPHALAAPVAGGMTAGMVEPLICRGDVLGAVVVVSTTRDRSFAKDELELLRLFAAQAAIAIENARLYEALDQSFRDLQRAQDELLRSEKLRALGQLAAGIAHDLNNMLAAVLGQVELLKLRITYPEVREALATIETAATDGADIVRRIQDFARQRATSRLDPCKLAAIVEEVIEITRPRWEQDPERQGVTITLRANVLGLPEVLGNAQEIREALTNIVINAVDAMPGGGEIDIRGTADEGSVLLSVRDTGQGMPDEVRSRIFEPFFTTKGVRGTGLGLSMVYGIMERHGGRVAVNSTPGHGTTFTLQFQRATTEGAAVRPAPGKSLPAPHRILLVDDDPLVRRTMATLLRSVGQQVVEAEGGAAALRELAGRPFDLVFTDLGMPDLSGWQVAEAVKRRHPNLPVVLVTGWQDQVIAEAEQRRFVDAVLTKPSRLEDLLRVIRELEPSSGH